MAIHPDKMSSIPGDCLSPLLFCITLNALKNELTKTDCVYQVHKTERKISHKLCMDDLKLLVRDEDELENEIKIVKAIGKDINMNFLLKIVQKFDNNVAYSTIVYQLLILCNSEISFDIFRHQQQVITSYEVTSVADRDRFQFNVSLFHYDNCVRGAKGIRDSSVSIGTRLQAGKQGTKIDILQ